jgi:hypothetical protein
MKIEIAFKNGYFAEIDYELEGEDKERYLKFLQKIIL